MPILVAREYSWADTEAADEFIASAELRRTDPALMQAIARCADDTDEAVEIWEWVTARPPRSGH